MPRDPIPTWYFALVIVRRGAEFLIVREQKHGQHWYLPAGRVEPGESFVEAARRETLEESGVPVEIEGIYQIQHTPWPDGARIRVLFVARPTDDTPPKTTPDEHSLEARWISLADLHRYTLRSTEVRHLFQAIAQGAPVYPLSLLVLED